MAKKSLIFLVAKKKDFQSVLKEEDLDLATELISSNRLKTKTEEDLIILIEELNRN